MKDLITRKQYMENSKELFHDYYSQFITEATKAFVLSRIGEDKIKASTDPHLNDVVKMSSGPDGRWLWDYTPINLELARKAGEVDKNGLGSPSTHTCVGKAFAKTLLK